MRRECRERFPHHRGLATPTCIMARVRRMCRDACRDRYLSVSFEVGDGENVPGIHGACTTRNFAYLVRGPLSPAMTHLMTGLWWDVMIQDWLRALYSGNVGQRIFQFYNCRRQLVRDIILQSNILEQHVQTVCMCDILFM